MTNASRAGTSVDMDDAGRDAVPDYIDEFSTVLERDDVEEWEMVAALFHSAPGWFDVLARLRDRIVRVFGLRTASNNPRIIPPPYLPGMHMGFFRVIHVIPGEALLGDEDTHLDFRTALRLKRDGGRTWLTVSTVVHTRNRFGRIYLTLVRPVHRLVVPIMLKGMARILTTRSLPANFYARART